MTSAENDRSEGPAPGDGGEAGDWTTWLRSRLERVAAPERRQDLNRGDQRQPQQDPDGDATPPAPPPADPGPPDTPASRLPPPGEEPSPATLEVGGAGAEVPPVRPRPRALPGLTEPLAGVPAHELLAGLDRLESVVTSLSARVDGLADAILTFRSVMHERLDEYTETVLRAAKAGASDVQEYRRMHTASLGELRRNASDTADTLRRLTGWMEELARIQGDDERWATALSQAFEEAAAERREGEVPAHEVVSALPERLERIDQALAQLGQELAAEPPDPLLPVVRSLGERLERIERALAEQSGEQREPPLGPVMSTLVDRLERVEHAVAGLGEELADRSSAPAAPDADPPVPPARSRRTTPIRAPSRSPRRSDS